MARTSQTSSRAAGPAERRPAAPPHRPCDITAVICTYNRHDLLPEAIASIELQDYPVERFELLVVDNSDDTAAQKRFLDGLQITCRHRYLTEARPGLSRARNIGVNAAASDIVAFMDDDARAAPDWLRRITETFAEHADAAIVGGPVRPIWTAPRPAWLHPWLEGYLTIVDRGPVTRPLADGEWLAGTNISFRTEALKQAGLFPENMGRIGRLLLSNEELAVSTALRERGYTAVYNPAIAVHHRVHPERATQAWLRRRVFWQAISDIVAANSLPPEQGSADADIHHILDFLMRLAPQHRGAMGLFVDVDDPLLFEAQAGAIGALARLMADDGGDWRRIVQASAARR